MSTYVPTAVELVDITLPADGENIDAADVNGPMQEIADGVKFLSATVATITALAAITTPTDGAVRHVLGFGWYTFKTSATTGLSPFRVAATDLTVGGWVASDAHETTRSIHAPCDRIHAITGDGAGAIATVNPTGVSFSWAPLAQADGLFDYGSFYALRTFTGATNHYGFKLPLDEFLIHGGTLASVLLYYRPTSAHAALPTRQPKIAVVRTPRTGYSPTPAALLSTGSGFAQDTAPDIASFEADRTLVYTPDQNNVIDKLTYRYYAIILDSAGTNAVIGNGFHSVELFHNAIPDGRRG